MARDAFEDWYKTHGATEHDEHQFDRDPEDGERYKFWEVQMAWEAWCAGRSSVPVEEVLF